MKKQFPMERKRNSMIVKKFQLGRQVLIYIFFLELSSSDISRISLFGAGLTPPPPDASPFCWQGLFPKKPSWIGYFSFSFLSKKRTLAYRFAAYGSSCCCCMDYSVLMYRDEIQLEDVKECFWYELQWLIQQWMSDPHSRQSLLIIT